MPKPTGAPIYAANLPAGKRILITGGGTGLGRGVSRLFVAHGAEDHLWGRRLEVLEEAAREIREGRPGSAHQQTVDVRKAHMVDQAMGAIWEGTARPPG